MICGQFNPFLTPSGQEERGVKLYGGGQSALAIAEELGVSVDEVYELLREQRGGADEERGDEAGQEATVT